MTDGDTILIDNLRSNLDHAERHIVRSIASALLLVVLIRAVPDLRAQGAGFAVPVLGPVGPDWAGFLFMAACLTWGTLAVSAVSRSWTIAARISDPALADAALTFPSIVTATNRFLRIAAALVAPGLLVVGYLLERGRQESPVTVFTLLGIALFCLPFFLLAGMLWPGITPRRAG